MRFLLFVGAALALFLVGYWAGWKDRSDLCFQITTSSSHAAICYSTDPNSLAASSGTCVSGEETK